MIPMKRPKMAMIRVFLSPIKILTYAPLINSSTKMFHIFPNDIQINR